MFIGAHEFPPLKIQKMNRRAESSSNNSAFKGLNSQSGGSDNNSEVFSPNKSSQLNNAQTGFYSKFSNYSQVGIEEKEGIIFMKDLPQDISSPYWQKGFIWKGVYFRLYSKHESERLKREMKALKHLSIECLQTESTIKVNDMAQQSINESISQDNNIGGLNGFGGVSGPVISTKGKTHLLSILLPLITYVESSSWVLMGSAILPTKKGMMDDIFQRLQVENLGLFKNTFLLCNANLKNFKLYTRINEEILTSNPTVNYNNMVSFSSNQNQNTYGSIPTVGMTPVSNTNTASINQTYLVLCNANRLVLSLPKANIMFVMHQDINSNILYLEFPKRNQIDFGALKKLLGYNKLDINLNNLKKKRGSSIVANDISSPQEGAGVEKGYFFDIIKFKRMGWIFQIIHIITKDSNFQRNKRAMELLNMSKSKRYTSILANKPFIHLGIRTRFCK